MLWAKILFLMNGAGEEFVTGLMGLQLKIAGKRVLLMLRRRNMKLESQWKILYQDRLSFLN